MFTIEKNVPIPDSAIERRKGRTKYPFATMEVGDSFFVPGDRKLASTITSAQNRSGFRFASWNAEKDGVAGTYVQRIEGESPIKAPKRKAKAVDAPGVVDAPDLPTLPEPGTAPAKPGRVARG